MTDDKQTSSERLFSPKEIAERMNLSIGTILRLVKGEPGIIEIVEHGLMRDWITIQIPESVWNRVYDRLVVKAG